MEMTMQNNCDGSGPHADGIVKLMPTGGGGNMILCASCWTREIATRSERNAKMRVLAWDLPAWETARVYDAAGSDDAVIALLWDYLKRDPEHKDRRQTGIGTKTKTGLVASVRRAVLGDDHDKLK